MTESAGPVCYCYVLECCDGSLYTGWTTDPARRLRDHNAGRGSRYTRARRPVRLVHLEELGDRASAMKREREIKRLSRARKDRLVAGADQNLAREKREMAQRYDPLPF